MFSIEAQEIWKVVKPYYHNPDADITRCVISLSTPYEHNSTIQCSYGDSTGGIQELSFTDVVFIFDALKKHGIADIRQTMSVVVRLEIGKPVEVEHTYYV